MSGPADISMPILALGENRVVLPLDYARDAARMLCMHACRGGVHIRPCLVPLLAERDRMMAERPKQRYGVSPDCVVGGVKCQACTGNGCEHACHKR